MSLSTEIQGALDELAEAAAQSVTINAVSYPAIVSQVALASEFLPGAELTTAQLTARISKSCLASAPEKQGTLTYNGTDYRIETVTTSGHSYLLGLTSLEN